MSIPLVTMMFRWPVRVYYEDTDAAGVVYYASYLRFFERCRTEWLRFLGLEQTKLAQEHGIAFVVRAVNVDYLKPGRLDDLLECRLIAEKIGRAQIVFRQEIHRQNDLLAVALVKAASVDAQTMKLTSMPASLRQKLENPE